MNKQKNTRYTGRNPDKKIGYLRRTTVSLYSADRQNGYNQTSKEIYLMQKKEYHFFILNPSFPLY